MQLQFPYETFLANALSTLAEHGLIKRVGVASFMYVHKSHIRPWLVHTFHIKRLDRETIGSTAAKTIKRKAEEANTETSHDDAKPSTSKKIKLDEANTATANDDVKLSSSNKIKPDEATSVSGKRKSKPVQRFDAVTEVQNTVAAETIK